MVLVNGEITRTAEPPRPSSSRSDHPPRPSSSQQQPIPSSSRPASSSSARQIPSRERDYRNRNGKLPERGVDVEVLVENRVISADEEADIDEKLEEARLLDGVPLEVQEAWICEDMMFVLQVSAIILV